MDQLRFTGLYEDGRHAVLTAADGSEFLVAIDDRLRAAVRRLGSSSGGAKTPATPRGVQAQVRAGASAEEVAESTGWTVERIERYEGPILAEREYVAGLARAALVRTHERGEAPPTLESRARERLNKRGVDLRQVSWDSVRPTGGSWSVQVHFKAGQRARSASWSFDPVTRSVDAIDDEARWLSEDEQSLPAGAAATALLGGGSDAPDDLMSAMRERSKRRGASGRRRKSAVARGPEDTPEGAEDADGDGHSDDDGGRERGGGGDHGSAAAGLDITPSGQAGHDPSAVSGRHDIPHVALPLEDLPEDPHTMGPQAVAGADEGGPEQDGGNTTDHPDPSTGRDGEVTRDDESDDQAHHDLNAEAEDDLDLDEGEDREATLADFFGSDEDADRIDDAEDGAGGHGGGSDDYPTPDDGDADRIDDAEGGHGGGSDDYPAPDDDAERDGVDSRDVQAAGAPQTPASHGRGEKRDKGGTRGRKGRTSVPSWDDIMFGAKDRGR